MAPAVLDQVQEFDQVVAPARAVAQKGLDLVERFLLHLPAARRAAAAPLALARMDGPRRLPRQLDGR